MPVKGIRIFDNTIVIRRIGATLGGKKGNIPNRMFIAFDLVETNIYLGGDIGEAGKLKGTIQKEKFQWLKNSGLDLGENAMPSLMESKERQRL